MLERLELISQCPALADIALKLIGMPIRHVVSLIFFPANAITTGGYVLAGKVYRNRMIDLRISNSKLLERSIGIVSTIAGVSRERAEDCIMSSIHDISLDDHEALQSVRSLAPSVHIAKTVGRDRIVTTALLLATGITDFELSVLISQGKYSLSEARSALEAQPIIHKYLH